MKNKQSKYSCFLLVLIFLSTAFSTSLGDVLCIGENGHLGIEFSNQHCCDSDHRSCISDKQSLSHESNHIDSCGNCLDIPIQYSYYTKRPTSVETSELFNNQNEFFKYAATYNIIKLNFCSSKNLYSNNHGNSDIIAVPLSRISPILIC